MSIIINEVKVIHYGFEFIDTVTQTMDELVKKTQTKIQAITDDVAIEASQKKIELSLRKKELKLVQQQLKDRIKNMTVKLKQDYNEKGFNVIPHYDTERCLYFMKSAIGKPKADWNFSRCLDHTWDDEIHITIFASYIRQKLSRACRVKQQTLDEACNEIAEQLTTDDIDDLEQPILVRQ